MKQNMLEFAVNRLDSYRSLLNPCPSEEMLLRGLSCRLNVPELSHISLLEILIMSSETCLLIRSLENYLHEVLLTML